MEVKEGRHGDTRGSVVDHDDESAASAYASSLEDGVEVGFEILEEVEDEQSRRNDEDDDIPNEDDYATDDSEDDYDAVDVESLVELLGAELGGRSPTYPSSQRIACAA